MPCALSPIKLECKKQDGNENNLKTLFTTLSFQSSGADSICDRGTSPVIWQKTNKKIIGSLEIVKTNEVTEQPRKKMVCKTGGTHDVTLNRYYTGTHGRNLKERSTSGKCSICRKREELATTNGIPKTSSEIEGGIRRSSTNNGGLRSQCNACRNRGDTESRSRPTTSNDKIEGNFRENFDVPSPPTKCKVCTSRGDVASGSVAVKDKVDGTFREIYEVTNPISTKCKNCSSRGDIASGSATVNDKVYDRVVEPQASNSSEEEANLRTNNRNEPEFSNQSRVHCSRCSKTNQLQLSEQQEQLIQKCLSSASNDSPTKKVQIMNGCCTPNYQEIQSSSSVVPHENLGLQNLNESTKSQTFLRNSINTPHFRQNSRGSKQSNTTPYDRPPMSSKKKPCKVCNKFRTQPQVPTEDPQTEATNYELQHNGTGAESGLTNVNKDNYDYPSNEDQVTSNNELRYDNTNNTGSQTECIEACGGTNGNKNGKNISEADQTEVDAVMERLDRLYRMERRLAYEELQKFKKRFCISDVFNERKLLQNLVINNASCNAIRLQLDLVEASELDEDDECAEDVKK